MDTAVVTGATRGLGEAIARRFAEEGVHVVVCARESEDLEAVASEIESVGGSVTSMRADVRDEFDLERLMEAAARAGDGSGIDCVVANAAVYHGTPGETPLVDDSYSSFDDTLRVNLRGVYAAVREALPHLTDDARVLVPSGPVAREPTAGWGAYAVSKAAAEALARQFAAELEWPVGVVDPGRVRTDLTGGEGDRTPEEVAPLFWWAATEADPSTLDGGVVDLERFEG